MLWGMELSWAEEEIVRKYQPKLKQYGVYFDEEICNLIENCHQDLEYKIQAFLGWFLSIEYHASMNNKPPNLPDANETLVQALTNEWCPTDFQKKMLIQANLFSVDIAMREKLSQINFFRTVAYNIPHNSKRIEFFYRGDMIWEEYIPYLLEVSNGRLIEMYKFKANHSLASFSND